VTRPGIQIEFGNSDASEPMLTFHTIRNKQLSCVRRYHIKTLAVLCIILFPWGAQSCGLVKSLLRAKDSMAGG
jgi:hypothetical protein